MRRSVVPKPLFRARLKAKDLWPPPALKSNDGATLLCARAAPYAAPSDRFRSLHRGRRPMSAACRRPLPLILGALALMLAALLSGASLAADAAHGERLAKRWCASCHIVAPDQTLGADSVPTFASVARRLGFNADKTARFLMHPHPTM